MRYFLYTCLLSLTFITTTLASNLDEADAKATVALHQAFRDFDVHTGKDVYGPYFTDPKRGLGSTVSVLLNALNYQRESNERAYLRTEKVPAVPGPKPKREIVFQFKDGTYESVPFEDIETDTFKVQQVLDKHHIDRAALFPVLREIVGDTFLEMALKKYYVFSANAESPYRHFAGTVGFWFPLGLKAAELVKAKLESEFKRKSNELRYWVREGRKQTDGKEQLCPLRRIYITSDKYIEEDYEVQLARHHVHNIISTILCALELNPKKCEEHIEGFNGFAAFVEEHCCKEHEDCASVGAKLAQKLAVMNAQLARREAQRARLEEREEVDDLPYVTTDEEEEKDGESVATGSEGEEFGRNLEAGIYLLPQDEANFYKKRMEELVQEVEELKERLAEAKHYEQVDQAEYEEAEQEMLREKEALEQNIEQLTKMLKDAQIQNKDLSVQEAYLATQLSQYQQAFQSLMNEKAAAIADSQWLRQELANKDMTISFQKRVINKVQAEKAGLNAHLARQDQQLADISRDPANNLSGMLRYEGPDGNAVDMEWNDVIMIVADLVAKGFTSREAVQQLLNK